MWKAITTSLCALLLYSAVPPRDHVVIPPGKNHHFDYILRGPEYLLKPDLGSVVWEFKSSASDKEVLLKSYFEVKTDSELVLSITGINITSIRSENKYDRNSNFILSRYFYELKKNSADKMRNRMVEQLIFGLHFKQKNLDQKETVKILECRKLADGEYVSASCGDKPSGNVPDLFAVLAAVTHAPDLESRVKAKEEWPAVYGRQEGNVSLEKVEEKIIKKKHSAIPVILYNVKNIAVLLGVQKEGKESNKEKKKEEKETVAIRLGLRKEHPHSLEYAEIETDFGTLTLERKE